ncbi:RHS repeat-associated core domain-containing protein [Pseudomonas putida]|nr:RHS repeat-associated core domain-containing protein [Pseudomonas putida]
MRLFYCAGQAHTFKSKEDVQQIIRHGREVLAEYDTAARVVWGDKQASVLGSVGLKGARSIHYSAYGGSGSAANLPGLIGYAGYYWDALFGHYTLGNGCRSYSPGLMRFLSPDRFCPFGRGGLNAYGYCAGDPVNNIDPDGHAPVTLLSVFSRLNSAFSRVTGSSLVPIVTAKKYEGKIVFRLGGLTAFESNKRSGRNLPKLYISAHGVPGAISVDPDINVHVPLSVRSLHDMLVQGGVEMQGRQTHFLVCYSAMKSPTTGKSVASEMAALTNAQSSGYTSTVGAWEGTTSEGYTFAKVHGLLGGTSTKTRVGAIRNPHKLKKNANQLSEWSRQGIVDRPRDAY